ncbi:Ribose 1,5-bisphosphate phosphokinase PhnN [Rhodobacteraceae bacterium THAF1]|uniref:phosphonate metabolism protein/1,5-bisphosphokinase (PRPP-forming) PhnN n=1 Tax=Palleronia sp. THAF1 TaxID=2587842 RepID=UPI000F410C34|nr:phosphonate metabolism protein/1,5-bisphosphokinase (PRPP-forming) PhnN [Palleronia sp. THAF1]QFU09553.1 Ribose 1,5-bisphosphate phosphokinase PhnN [Palleronia sp. THAF1]VDC20082.1 Ribose 1,5-bisphosphate phosphokinase PhnN [Rhodobacteraceae bacterium THAF1]
MTRGRFIAVVGPSGVGKDSVTAGLQAMMPNVHLVRRVITRAPELGGEDFDAVDDQTFEEMASSGSFVLHWNAHGLRYGIPATVAAHLERGRDCLANLSRGVLLDAAERFLDFAVLHITATPDTLSRRLSARGRETAEDIALRLSRAQMPLPAGLDVIHVSNDGPLAETVGRAAALLQPASV